MGDELEQRVKKKVKKKIIKIIIGIILINLPLFLLIGIAVGMSTGGSSFYGSTAVDGNLSDEDNAKMLDEVKAKTEWINSYSTFDESGNRLEKLSDYYGTDIEFKQDWAFTLAYMKYKQISNNDTNENTIDDVEKNIENAVNDIAPKFVYKKDKIVTVTEHTVQETHTDPDTGQEVTTSKVVDDTTEKDGYFLTIAKNLQGTYEVQYKSETISNGVPGNKVTTTKPIILSVNQTDKAYDNLKDVVAKSNFDEDIDKAAYGILAGRNNYLGEETTIDNLLDTGAGTFTGTGETFAGGVKEFTDKVSPEAIKLWKQYNILPSITLAQGILESGNGKSLLTVKANNLFGVKAFNNWTGPYVEMLTREEDSDGNSEYVLAKFRAYNSWLDSIDDHAKVLMQNNFKAVRSAGDYRDAAMALQAGGYATDHNYASEIISVIEQYGLQKYDTQ